MLATVSPQVHHFSYFSATRVLFQQFSHPTCVILATLSPHQSPQHTHNIPTPTFVALFPALAIIFTLFLKKCFLPLRGSHFCKSTRCILTQKTHFLDPQVEQKPPCWRHFHPTCIMFVTFPSQVCHFRNDFAPQCIVLAAFQPKCVILAANSPPSASYW